MPGPTKITFGEMRGMGVRGVLIYCADYRCSHSIAGCAWRETDVESANRDTLIRHLLKGEYNNPLRVVVFNAAEGA